MKILRLFIFIFALAGLVSCNTNIDRIEQLEKENKKLHEEIEYLRSQMPYSSDFLYSAYVIPENSSIKLGEEYKAQVGLSIIYEKNPAKLVLCNMKNGELVETADTIFKKTNSYDLEYKTKPTKIGNYIWAGKIIQKRYDGIVREYPFYCKYSVTK